MKRLAPAVAACLAVLIAAHAAVGAVTARYPIAASADDTHCSADANYRGNDTMNFPYTSDTRRRPFFRWAVDIPTGATITSACLEVKSQSTRSVDTSIRLWLLDYDSCPSFSTNPYDSPRVAGAGIDWVLPNPFLADTWYTSPDLRALVQAFIDRPGYAPGTYLGLRGQWLSGGYRWIYQYDHSPADGAVLEVSYVINGGDNLPPTAHAGPDQSVTDHDEDGVETVTLDGSLSSDPDGTITDYTWYDGPAAIATGVGPQVSLGVGVHTLTLEVIDDDDAGDTDTVVIAVNAVPIVAPVYYVDFADGSDAYTGTSPDDPWQHCPGDSNVVGNAAGAALAPGDTVIFAGGVRYRGTIVCSRSGAPGQPITYDGNTAGTFGTGPAVIDGSEPLTGWTPCASAADAGGNPNWQNLWYAYAPASTHANTSNLYQYDTDAGAERMCWLAQDPNQADPFFMDSISHFHRIPRENVTTTSLTDPARLTQSDPTWWDGAFVMVWRVPNLVDARTITSFDPATDTITYAELDNHPYDDRDGRYALYNHISLIDQPGEYCFSEAPEPDRTHKVWLWPPAGDPNANGVSISVPAARDRAFRIAADTGYLAFDGLRIEKFAGGGLYGGGGINHDGADGVHDVTLTRCHFAYIRHDYRAGNGYGAIALGGSTFTITDNTFVELPVTNAIQLGASDSLIADNVIDKPGRHGLWMSFHNCDIIGNTMRNVRGSHADGIAVFNGSSNVNVIGNTILNSNVPLCTQNSSNVTVAYNHLHCPGHYAFADYGGCTNLLIHNNTVVRDDDKPSLRNDSGGQTRNNIRYTYAGNGSLVPDADGNLTINHAMDADVFADPGGGDFTLSAGGPAVDAGVDLGYTRDILGTPVPQGHGPDIGAYEYVARLPGDADGDGDVDLDDFVLLKQNFGMPAGATAADGDFDGDGDVDLDDFVILKQHFGETL
ncbi:MAG: right-handed parallel beta-helix repeat-containing protein [Planctomycetota bacterium]